MTIPQSVPESAEIGLARWFDQITEKWSSFASIFAFPFLHERLNDEAEYYKYMVRRDLLVVFMFAIAPLSLLAASQCRPIVMVFLTGLALFRAVDIGMGFVAIGMQGYLRKSLRISDLEPWRVRRVVLTALLNYVEVIFWYAVILLMLGQAQPSQMNVNSSEEWTAAKSFLLSMSTATTIGYGNVAPVGGISVAAVTVEAMTCLLFVAVVLSALVSLLNNKNSPQQFDGKESQNRYSTFGPAFALLFFLVAAGLIHCYLSNS